MSHRWSAAVLALAACRPAPRDVADAQPAIDAAADAGTIDAAPAPACEPSATRELAIAGVHLAAPPGCCFRRRGEGDDISGDIIDNDGRPRLHYVALAHDARVGDPCSAARGLRLLGTGRVGAASYRSCATASDAGPRHVCASVSDAKGPIVNLCADDPEAGYAPMDVVNRR